MRVKSFGVLLRKPPYGSVEAAEAVRHALGGITEELEVKVILLDGGVNAARKNQDPAGTEYSSIEEGIRDCIDMGAEVFADELSLKQHALPTRDVIDGVQIADSQGIAAIIRGCSQVMIF